MYILPNGGTKWGTNPDHVTFSDSQGQAAERVVEFLLEHSTKDNDVLTDHGNMIIPNADYLTKDMTNVL